ncbi:MAG TPA: endonuclease/exonuclease/phosphatase family protein, partial [Candidatus Paceibacterota bacterium]
MKIYTWNVNGIRAWSKKGALEWLIGQEPDIFCFQETKAHPDQLTHDLKNPVGYKSYFDHS